MIVPRCLQGNPPVRNALVWSCNLYGYTGQPHVEYEEFFDLYSTLTEVHIDGPHGAHTMKDRPEIRSTRGSSNTNTRLGEKCPRRRFAVRNTRHHEGVPKRLFARRRTPRHGRAHAKALRQRVYEHVLCLSDLRALGAACLTRQLPTL